MEEITETAKTFFCECCEYTTPRKQSYDRHLLTKKHAKRLSGDTNPITRRSRKSKIQTTEMETQTETQTDTEVECIVIQTCENEEKYISEILKLKEEIETLKETNELLVDEKEYVEQEKDELKQEIKQLNELLQDTGEDKIKSEIENKVRIEIENKNDEIYDLKGQIQDLNELIQEKNVLIEKLSKNDKIEMSIIEVEPQLTVKNKLMKINHQELEYKMSDEDIKKLIEENNEYMNKCMELEESISQMKLRIVDNDMENIGDEKQAKSKSKHKHNRKNDEHEDDDNLNDPENPINIYKDLCRNPKCNNIVMNHSTIDKSNGSAISTIKILKSIDAMEYPQTSRQLYTKIFNSIIEEMNSKNIKFIKCTDSRRKIFQVHNGITWLKYSLEKFKVLLLKLVGYIYTSLLEAINNTSGLGELEFKRLYKIVKNDYDGDGDRCKKQDIVLKIMCPIHDDKKDNEKDYIETIMCQCTKIFKSEKKDSEKKKKSKRRNKSSRSSRSSNSDSDSEDSDSDSDSADDDE